MEKHEELMQRGYVADACNVIKIVFVYKPEDLLTGLNYHRPSMTHQIFAEEAIYGYHGLAIYIYYLAHSGHCYFRICYDKCYCENGNPSPSNDDLLELLKPWFPSFTLNLDEISETLAREEKTRMFGFVVNSFAKCHNSLMQTYKVTQCSVEEPGFVPFHERFQSLIIMYIDAANFIDLMDEKWMVFYLYHQSPLERSEAVANYPIGFCTVYKFIKYPEKVRARISQFFIIPPFQRMGLGYKLLDTVYEVLKSMDEVIEITVESPNAAFTHLRDKLDLSHVISLPEFSPENVVKGYSKAMQRAAMMKFKICSRQSKHIYHIIRYYALCIKRIDDFEVYRTDVIAHLERGLKRSCHRNYSKFAAIESAGNKERYLEDQFYVFLKDVQTSNERLRQHFRAN